MVVPIVDADALHIMPAWRKRPITLGLGCLMIVAVLFPYADRVSEMRWTATASRLHSSQINASRFSVGTGCRACSQERDIACVR